MINRILVLGAGSAGFLTALTLKVRLPSLDIVVLRSSDIGIIGVGEGTTALVPPHLHRYLKIDRGEFFRDADPVPKLGIRYLNWGPRPFFDYTFGPQYETRFTLLPRETGYYCADDLADAGLYSAMMSRDHACQRGPRGELALPPHMGYHLENRRFVELLERYARRSGITIIDDTVAEVPVADGGVTELRLASGLRAGADLYIDCSGFRSMLLGETLEEPFVSFKSSLFCDRAVVGGWDRGPDEPIHPYTTAEGMDSGWCWRIDHEQRINRGYVYSGDFISDGDAEVEFRRNNPKVGATRIVKFRSGRYRNLWVKNVVAIGNASGFVEPLEATALGAICGMAQNLTEILFASGCDPQPSTISLFNRASIRQWDQIRQFLAVHYRFNNTRPQTPFWQACREDVDLSGAEPIAEFYHENGPSAVWRNILTESGDSFGPEGYLSILVGMRVPWRRAYVPSEAEQRAWAEVKKAIATQAKQGMDVPEMLRGMRGSAAGPAFAGLPAN